ncbi:MAG: FAD-dependent oxidoreductase [Enhydrobacter sp.]|nr:MAG: FAD-dependent oxidoreductase [Enhydrobacter sp.]
MTSINRQVTYYAVAMRRRLLLTGTLGVLATPARAVESDVAIVGAGIAGLAAARALMAAGRSVVVIEARERIGGRVFTDPGLGFPFDHGAQFLEPGPLARALGGRPVSSGPQALMLGGKELDRAQYDRYEKLLTALRARIAEVGQAAPGIDPFRLLMRQDPLEVLALAELARATPFAQDQSFAEGMAPLVRQWAAKVPVTLGSRVVRIDSTGRLVLLVTTSGDVRARTAIVTVPAPVLANGPGFAPPLSAARREALAGLRTASYMKVALAFSRRVMEAPANARVFSLGKAGRAVDFLLRPQGREAAILFVAGEAASQLERQGASAAGAHALTLLAELFGKEVRFAHAGSQATRWGLDPHALGAWPVRPPAAALAAAHHERIFFAGDSTADGTLVGAYGSGLRAAEQARKALT